MSKRILVVGAGFYGAVCARELADAGHIVHVVERRDHIGGNCYTRFCHEADCNVHVYGAHIFHTGSQQVWNYVNRFAAFNHYVNHVKVNYQGRLYSFPINLFTLHQIYGVTTPAEARAKLAQVCSPIANPGNLEEYCLATVGPELYRIFIEGYTTKQWNRHPRDLPAAIIKRVPIRLTLDDNYFDDCYQGVPVDGYTALFESLLKRIPVELEVDFLVRRDELMRAYDYVIYTGPIDAFFGYCHGALEYRSLHFESELLDTPDFQGNAVVNYPDAAVSWTRILEHKHFDLRLNAKRTLVTRECPSDWKPGMSEYYPLNDARNNAILEQYQAEAAKLVSHVHFGGRLGEYRYYNMDQVIGRALEFCARLQDELEEASYGYAALG